MALSFRIIFLLDRYDMGFSNEEEAKIGDALNILDVQTYQTSTTKVQLE